jgi:hypothetical protein
MTTLHMICAGRVLQFDAVARKTTTTAVVAAGCVASEAGVCKQSITNFTTPQGDHKKKND